MAKSVTVTTPSDNELVVTRVIAAPRDRVFASFTKPEWLTRWLTGTEGWSLVVCDIDLRAGGKYRYVWRGPDGAEMGMGGEYREIVPPERIVATELFDEDWTGGETLVTTTFTEQDGNTKVETTVRYSSKEARDGALASDMSNGMAESYDKLEEVLAATD